jgi:osmoprotectant transport system permease protein
VLAAYDGHALVDWSWVGDHGDEIVARLREHAVLLGWSMLLALLVAIPLALVSVGRRRVYGSVLATTGILYTIPSLAAFSLLLPYTGQSRLTAIIPLATYGLLILVRNMVTGLERVPGEVQDAATGLGYSRRRKLWQVDVPLALPAIFAGIRLAVVTTIGLIPVSALIGQGGLGALMTSGFEKDFYTPLVVGVALTVVFAFVADGLLLAVQKLLTPWARGSAVR